MMICIVMVFLILYLYLMTQKEGFEERSMDPFQGKVYRNEKMYDPFYAYNYDDLRLTVPYLVEMIQHIFPYFQSGKTLCLGSKNGHVVQLLSKSFAVGAESSKAMVDVSRYKYPELSFVHGNYTSTLFPSHSFSQIVLPLWTLHTLPNLSDVLFSLKEWIIHTGYVFVCFVDIHTFPIHFLMPDPSEYFSLNYEYGIERKGNQYIETIQDKTFQVRTNVQDLYAYTEQRLIETARSVGFTHVLTLPFDAIPMSIAVFQNK